HVRVHDRLGVVLCHGQVVVLEPLGPHTLLVVVELVDQQHVGAHVLDDLGDVAGLLTVGGGQLLGEGALFGAFQGGVEGGQAYLARPRWIGDRRRLRAEGGRGHQGGSGQDEGGGRGDTAGSVGHGDHSLSGRDRTAGPADRAPVSRGDRSSVVPPHVLGKCHRNLSESSRLDASGL